MKKLLNTLYIVDESCYLALEGENILCKKEGEVKFRLPFTNIEEILNVSGIGEKTYESMKEYITV